jgi:quinol monooxygenase YgiN
MDKVFITARFLDIDKANLATFKELAAHAIEDAKPVADTLSYDWFFNADETECVVLEAFADSDALIAHSSHMTDLLPKMIGLSGSFEFECYGNPSPALLDAISFPDGSVFTFHAGK